MDSTVESTQRFQGLHSTITVEDLCTELWVLLTSAFPLHSFTLYLNYLDSGTGFRVIHHQVTPGQTVPWSYRREVTPAVPFLQSNRGATLFSLDDMYSDRRQLERSSYFQNVMRFEGWQSLVSVCSWGALAPRAVLTLRKAKQHGEFSHSEFEWLKELQKHFETTMSRVERVEHLRVQKEIGWSAFRRLPAPAILIAPDGDILLRTEAAATACERLQHQNGPDDRQSGGDLPDVLLQLHAAQDDGSDSGATEHYPHTLAHDIESRGWVAHRRIGDFYVEVHRLWLGLDQMKRRYTLLFLHDAASDQQGRLEPERLEKAPSVLPTLTARERLVAKYAAQGLSDRQIAHALKRSVHTVRSQIASARSKLNARNRIDLILAVKASESD